MEMHPGIDHHKLFDLHKVVQGGQGAIDCQFQLGTYVDGLGNGALRGGCIRLDHRNLDGANQYVVSFKVSKGARQKLAHLCEELQVKHTMSAFQSSLQKFCKQPITIEQGPFVIPGRSADSGKFSTTAADAYKPKLSKEQRDCLTIKFGELGTVKLNTYEAASGLYHTITVELPENQTHGKSLKDLMTICTAIGLGPILEPQNAESDERMKMMQLFRTFYPRVAYEFEKSAETDVKPPLVLQKEIVEKAPGMQKIFQRYLGDQKQLMQKVEVHPDYRVWAVSDLSTQMRLEGGVGLMMGVIYTKDLTAMMQYGAVSSQDRLQAGKFIPGASTEQDMLYGSSDQVFTRMISQPLAKDRVSDFDLAGSAQLLFSLDAVNRGCYVYSRDQHGRKDEHDYAARLNPLESLRAVDDEAPVMRLMNNNEVMIRNRIPPNQIVGVVVKDEATKKKLLESWRTSKDIIRVDNKGNETINGFPIDKFIYVADRFSPSMWTK